MAVTDLEEGHAPDPFRFADYDWNQRVFLAQLERRLRMGPYRPGMPLELTFPKTEFAVRPGRRIELDDLTVLYFGLLGVAADLEDKLKPGVTAYRLRRRHPPGVVIGATYLLPRYLRRRLRFVDPWYNAWPRFRRRLQQDWQRGIRRHLGVTDITSFYEDIDLAILRDVVRDRVRRTNRPLVNLLVEMYEQWSARDVHSIKQNRGLPQGTTSSGVLANYYLMPIDDALHDYARRRSLRWYRYSDDTRLTGATRDSVQLGLRIIGRELTRLNLIQNAAKTKVFSGKSGRRVLFDGRMDKIATIRMELASGTLRSNSIRARIRRLDAILLTVRGPERGDRSNSTCLAMLYGAYGLAGADRLLRDWVRDYRSEPQRAGAILGYVRGFLARPGQARVLLRVLSEERWRASSWELAQFLRTARHMHRPPPEAAKLLASIAQRKLDNWFVRQQAIVSIGWFRLEVEARALLDILFTEWDEEVRRSIVTLSFFRPQTEVKLLEQAARDLSPKVSRMANFLLKLREDRDLAAFNLKKFREPNEVFFVDSYWRLYQIAHNRDPQVRTALIRVIERTRDEAWGQFARSHLRYLRTLADN